MKKILILIALVGTLSYGDKTCYTTCIDFDPDTNTCYQWITQCY